MSNYLAISTVTATLQRIVQAAIQKDVEGARVTTFGLSEIGNNPLELGVNVFLYQVTNNYALNNADLAAFRVSGNTAKRQTALDLYYMLSFYGNNNQLIPQQMLGCVIRTLNDLPALTPAMIKNTVAEVDFLKDSDLAEQIQKLELFPLNLDLELLGKTWSLFSQASYVLSVAYKVAVVIIDGEQPAQLNLPVRNRPASSTVPFPHKPVIEKVLSDAGKFEPILADTTLRILGKNLNSSNTLVRIGEIKVKPKSKSENCIILPLSSLPANSLQAGIGNLQVIHQISIPQQGILNKWVDSNVLPFVLCPTITDVVFANIEDSDDDLIAGIIIVQVNIIISQKQRVVLALNEWSIHKPVAYMFEASIPHADTRSISIPIKGVKPGEYLVRLQVDGAESQMDIDKNPDSPTFNWFVSPKVLIQ
ncbi:MAG: DUF4255 domain-containing protein [Cyanobacteria bacterium J06633_8]